MEGGQWLPIRVPLQVGGNHASRVPNSNLRVSPHIRSKLHTWNKLYYALAAILDKSGVGFNLHGDYKLDCDDNVWEEITKVDNKFLRLWLCI